MLEKVNVLLNVGLDDQYELAFLLADEMQAYVKTRRPADSTPRHLLLREPDLEWVPDEYRERIALQLKGCPRGVLLKLLVYLYGDIEAGFRYEDRRNKGFVSTGAKHRHGTSVFLFTDTSIVLASGRPARWESSETDPSKVCVFGENNSAYQKMF